MLDEFPPAGTLEGLGTGATPRDVAGNAPLILDNPADCLLVLSGEVEIFLVERLEDGGRGTRQHLFGARPGDVMFGLDAGASLLEVSFLAVGTPGTRVLPLDRGALLSAGGTAGTAAIDRWITGLSQGMTRPIVPRPRTDRMIAAGEEMTSDRHQRVSSAHGVVWCAGSGDGNLIIDMEVMEPGGLPLPLTRDSWISVSADAVVTAAGTADMLAAGTLGPALDRFHALAVDVLPMALRLSSVDEVNRLRAQEDGDRRAAGRALDTLAGVFGIAPGAAAAMETDQPLLRALGRLGEVLGFQLEVPPHREDEPRPFTLTEVAQASRLRTRELTLDAGWWRADSGAFLLLREEDGRPLAVWPVGGHYRLHDPVAGGERRLSPEEAAGLKGEAFVVYPPLPDRPLRIGDLLAATLRTRLSDLGTLIAATVLAGVLALSVPLATTYILDTVIPDNDLGKLWEVAAALLLVSAMTFVLRAAAQIASLRVEGLAGSRLQAAVMDRLLRLPAGFFRKFTAGELATRVLAVERLETALTASMIGSVMTGAIAVVSYGLMLAYSWRLGLVAIVLTLGLALITVVLGLRRVRREAMAVVQDAKVVGLSLELAGGISKLRLAAAEDRAFLRWSLLYADASRSRLGADQAAAHLSAVTTGYTALATACILAVCVYWDLTGALTLGLLVAFLAAFNTALGGMAALANTAIDLVALAPIARHAAPILDAVPEADMAKVDPGELSGALEISRLKFQYHADTPPVFNDLSLRVSPGEFVALVGPSGTGKSTLFRLLLGFEQATSGVILYDGLDIAGLDVQAVRRQCGVVLQNGRLMPGSVLDNILGANMHLDEEAAWEAARQAALADDILRMPMGMHTMVTDNGSAFSGGQVQRIMLARAIAAKPRILLLDEATSALDNRTQAVVTDSLNRVAATRLVIAHRLSTVERADRIVVLNAGRVQEEGTYAELMAEGGFFAAFARRQLTGQGGG